MRWALMNDVAPNRVASNVVTQNSQSNNELVYDIACHCIQPSLAGLLLFRRYSRHLLRDLPGYSVAPSVLVSRLRQAAGRSRQFP